MPWIVYPETREVSEAWVVSRAHDAMVDAALDAEAVRRGVEGVPDDYWPDVPQPSYDEARAFLDDAGIVTFAADGADPRRLAERAREERLLDD